MRGSALIYILIAVALLAALTVSLMEPSNQQSQSQNVGNVTSEIESQISFISSTIQECVLGYPDQDSELTVTQQKNPPYPINPRDPYFNAQSATPGTEANNNVEFIRCPGNPGGSGPTNQNHARLFGSTSGKFLPPAPNLFTPWQYYNGADGVFIVTSTNKTDAYLQTALTRLNDNFSACEAEAIDATGAAVNLTTDTTPGDSGVRQCPSGSRCFRYWIILKAGAVHTEASCP
jgi:type II secretory pathway pseudopilin PulG